MPICCRLLSAMRGFWSWPSSKPSKNSFQDSSTECGSCRQRWYCASMASRLYRLEIVSRDIGIFYELEGQNGCPFDTDAKPQTARQPRFFMIPTILTN